MISKLMALDQLNATSVIDLYDQIMTHVDVKLRRKMFHTLRKLCAATGILPKSFHIPTSKLVRSDDKDGRSDARGAYADVWRARYEGEHVARKVFRIAQNDDIFSVKKIFCREVICWKRLCHPNVTRFLGVEDDGSSLCMISQWMEYGTLSRYLKDYPTADRLGLIKDIVLGLQYLHSDDIGIIHGDLKGTNVLINAERPPRGRLVPYAGQLRSCWTLNSSGFKSYRLLVLAMCTHWGW